MIFERFRRAVCQLLDDLGFVNATEPITDASAAFLVALGGEDHPQYSEAIRVLGLKERDGEESATVSEGVYAEPPDSKAPFDEVLAFYRRALRLIPHEIETAAASYPELGVRITELAAGAQAGSDGPGADDPDRRWSVFFPEGVGIRGQEGRRIERLRARRSVSVERRNPEPITDVAREVVFTSNVLLTVPPDREGPDAPPFSDELNERIQAASAEPQRYWYDHPIPIGIDPARNEILHGLRGLQQTLRFERKRGTTVPEARLTCLLSVSVTHEGLQSVARRYVEEELRRAGDWEGLDVYVFSEADARRLARDVLVPAVALAGRIRSDAASAGPASDGELSGDGSDGGSSGPVSDGESAGPASEQRAAELLQVFGTDGAYGRHYSFLKAMPALWAVLIDPHKRGTFKIDLDQRFPNETLVEETGGSAFEHLGTPLWGASGTDAAGRAVELGMIAGALVNVGDIERSVFTPDVTFPNRNLAPDERVFFSSLPQALSTAAEMTTRYGGEGMPDGRSRCLQRVHVTGGTNGILFEYLRRHRPFTPSFIGRAEDQAYLLSVLNDAGPQLGHAHASGLIMRHDKHAFAQQAMEAAAVGKLIGDYERILYFSAYGRMLGLEEVKAATDPFTGCFVSRIPITVTCVRFALKALGFSEAGEVERGNDFLRIGARRIGEAIDFAFGPERSFELRYGEERSGWDLFYDVLDGLQEGLQRRDPRALELHARAREAIEDCRVRAS